MIKANTARVLGALFLDVAVAAVAKLRKTKKTADGLDQKQAHAITEAVQKAIEDGDHVTPEMLAAALAALEVRIIRWMIGIVLAGTVLVIAAVRLFGG